MSLGIINMGPRIRLSLKTLDQNMLLVLVILIIMFVAFVLFCSSTIKKTVSEAVVGKRVLYVLACVLGD